MSRKLLAAAALAALTALAGAEAAHAGPPGHWTQVTGAGKPDLNTLRAGLARTPDGVLHVGWTQPGDGIAGSVMHSAISADAATVSGPDRIAGYSNGANQSVALVRAPEGLRAFFAGLEPGSPLDEAVGSAVSADGRAWSVQASAASRAGDAAKPAYVAAGLAATVGLDGTFYSIWGDSAPGGGGFHTGLGAGDPDADLPGGLKSDPGLGVDGRSGQVVAGWNLIDGSGVVVMPLAPLGQPVTLPGSTAALQHRVAITGRAGAPGVYAAYTQGANPFTGRPALYRVDTGQVHVLSSQAGRLVSVAAAPGGRLWAFWIRDGTVLAMRSNTAATRFGPLRAVKLPGGAATTVFDLAGEGSAGPLDVLALLDPPAGELADYHQRILPALTLTVKRRPNRRRVLAVADAGDAVAGAKVRLTRAGTKTTGTGGSVKFTLAKGAYTATASKPGFVSATARVTVR